MGDFLTARNSNISESKEPLTAGFNYKTLFPIASEKKTWISHNDLSFLLILHRFIWHKVFK
jgi:hypothetical protein